MSDLADKKCVPCQGGVPPIEGEEIDDHLGQLDARWEVVDGHHLETEVEFGSHEDAVDFVARVADLAEEANHHPEVCLTHWTVTVRVWTFDIDGLFDNDFILAARIDNILDERAD